MDSDYCGPMDNNPRSSFNCGPMGNNSRSSFNCGPMGNNPRSSFNCGPMDNNSRSSFNCGPMDNTSRSSFNCGPAGDPGSKFSEGFAIGRAMREARASFMEPSSMRRSFGGTDPSMTMQQMDPTMTGMDPMMMMKMMNAGGGGGGMRANMMDRGMGPGPSLGHNRDGMGRDSAMAMMMDPDLAAMDRFRYGGGKPTTDSIDKIYATCRERAARRVGEYMRNRRGSGGMGFPDGGGGDNFDAMTGGPSRGGAPVPRRGSDGMMMQSANQSSSQAQDRPGGESADEKAIRSELERLQRETREMEAKLRTRGTGGDGC